VGSQSLSGGAPSRLVEEAGQWVLEVVRHVNLGQDLVRPTTQRLSGNRTITAYFNSNPERALLGKATQRLMQSESLGGSRSFTVVGNEWIATSIPPGPPDAGDNGSPGAIEPTVEGRLGDLKGQVLLLAAVQEGLLVRLARLETKLLHGGVPPRDSDQLSEPAYAGSPSSLDSDQLDAGAPRVSAGARRGSEPRTTAEAETPAHTRSELSPDSGRDAGAAGGSPPGPPPSAAPAAVPPSAGAPGGSASGAAVPMTSAATAEAKPAEERRELSLPPSPELGRCIALLLGGNTTAEDAPPFPVNRVTKDCYAAPIQDEAGRTVGLILLDLRATVFLGGTLMMLPASELDQQLAACSPGEDSIAAAAEICNALAGAINGLEAQRVHVGAMEKFDFKSSSWVTDPVHRRDLLDNFGGRTVVLSRRLHQPPIG
jgi:hypothetical protein